MVCRSEFGGAQDVLLDNCKRFTPGAAITVLNRDWKDLDPADLLQPDTLPSPLSGAAKCAQGRKFDIYLYDGGHTYIEQYRALTHFWEVLSDVFILIVDDWNWKPVRGGTMDALHALAPRAVHRREVRLTQDDTHTPLDIAHADFWNGTGIFVIQK